MDFTSAVVSQYLAALAMLKQTITHCPEAQWNNPDDQPPLWDVVYHTLFYTYFYLQDSEQSFVPWANHRPGYHRLDPDGRARDPYTPAELLDYLAVCQQEVAARVPRLAWDAPSGFRWLPFNKFELQLYVIRHIQQHAGELMERLSRRTGAALDWVGVGARE